MLIEVKDKTSGFPTRGNKLVSLMAMAVMLMFISKIIKEIIEEIKFLQSFDWLFKKTKSRKITFLFFT